MKLVLRTTGTTWSSVTCVWFSPRMFVPVGEKRTQVPSFRLPR